MEVTPLTCIGCVCQLHAKAGICTGLSKPPVCDKRLERSSGTAWVWMKWCFCYAPRYEIHFSFSSQCASQTSGETQKLCIQVHPAIETCSIRSVNNIFCCVAHASKHFLPSLPTFVAHVCCAGTSRYYRPRPENHARCVVQLTRYRCRCLINKLERGRAYR